MNHAELSIFEPQGGTMATIPNTLRIRNALENAIVQGIYAPGARLDPEAVSYTHLRAHET